MASHTAASSGCAGYQVRIARHVPKDQRESQVQMAGIDHKLDGRVLRAKQEPSGNGLRASRPSMASLSSWGKWKGSTRS